jgi:hypothetical protein
MLVLAILAVIVSLGIVFLIYFFINLCRDSPKGNAAAGAIGSRLLRHPFGSEANKAMETADLLSSVGRRRYPRRAYDSKPRM